MAGAAGNDDDDDDDDEKRDCTRGEGGGGGVTGRSRSERCRIVVLRRNKDREDEGARGSYADRVVKCATTRDSLSFLRVMYPPLFCGIRSLRVHTCTRNAL